MFYNTGAGLRRVCDEKCANCWNNSSPILIHEFIEQSWPENRHVHDIIVLKLTFLFLLPSTWIPIPQFHLLSTNVASIRNISFNQLKNNVNDESEKLFQACQENRFSLLKPKNGDQDENLLGDAEKMIDVTTLTITIDCEVLKEYAYQPQKSILE